MTLVFVLTGIGATFASGARNSPPLILVSIDGYRADYIDRGDSPTLSALTAEGVHAKALRP